MARSRAKRQSSVATYNRIRAYPWAEWSDTEREWVAGQEEDFPGVTPQAFIQDLHNLARRHTTLAKLAGEGEGWGVQTSVRAPFAGDGEVAFHFYRRPFAECPSSARIPGDRPASGMAQQQRWPDSWSLGHADETGGTVGIHMADDGICAECAAGRRIPPVPAVAEIDGA